MKSVYKLSLFIFFTNILYAIEAQAVIPWHVVDTYIETVKTFSSTSKPGSKSITTETSTEQYKDSDGNTIEKVTTKTFEITADIVEKVVQKRQVFKMEKVNRRGITKRKTHKGRTYRETITESSGETKTLVDTEITETIITRAIKTETPADTPKKTEGNVAINQDFGSNAQYMGTRTEMVSNESTYYLNLDEFSERSNAVVNQDAALARGWTGKGSTIGIIDTGIDLDHSEFNSEGKIVYMKDFTGTGMQDTVGHGSHVAGIAAGEMDGEGIMGIAPDANLAIIKVSDNWHYSMSWARKGLKDMINNVNDLAVVNISANTNYSADYRDAMTNHGDGIFTNDHVYYGGENYYNLEIPSQWTNKLVGNDVVLVFSAGNQSNDYVQNPASFATATDSDGNLLGDGRILIAGMWNFKTETVEGGKAGHICKNFSGDQCNDAYRTSDFYLLAPGSGVTSANFDGTYKQMSGTSQAAPVVSGAVAVIHQMWPYMSGNNIVKVLTTTADKSITGYDVNTHGQGLLDLDKATQPIGDVGISYTGRKGTTVPLSGGIAIAGGDDSSLSSLNSVSVVDSIDRHYTINLKPAATTMNSLIPIYQLDHAVGSSWSSKFVGGAMEHKGMYFNTYETPYTIDRDSVQNFTVGFDDTVFMKRNPYTGILENPSAWQSKFTFTQSYGSPFMAFSGMWGQTRSSQTFEFSQMYKPNNFYGQIGLMYTTTQFEQGLVKQVDPISSVYGMVGWANQNWNLYVGFKPTVISGNVHMQIPTSVDAAGNMHYTSAKASLKGEVIKYIGAQFNLVDYKDKFNNGHALRMNGVVDEYGDSRFGSHWIMEF